MPTVELGVGFECGFGVRQAAVVLLEQVRRRGEHLGGSRVAG
jgi:hypothetical protein